MPGLRTVSDSPGLYAIDPRVRSIQEPEEDDATGAVAAMYEASSQRRHVSAPLKMASTFSKPFLAFSDNEMSDADSESDSSIHAGFENLRWPRASYALAPPSGFSAGVGLLRGSSITKDSKALAASNAARPTVPKSQLPNHTTLTDPPAVLSSTIIPSRVNGRLHSPDGMKHQLPPGRFYPKGHLLPDSPFRTAQSPSSRAESFWTAREDAGGSALRSPVSPISLNYGRETPKFHSETTGHLNGPIRGTDEYAVAAKSVEKFERLNLSQPHTQAAATMPSPLDSPVSFPELDKHISYVSGPDELEKFEVSPVEATEEQSDDGALESASLDHAAASAQLANNSVYQHLQAQNVKRHSQISSTSGMITASVIFANGDTTPKRLKRTTKCSSLRDGGSPVPSSINGGHSPENISSRKIRQAENGKLLGSSALASSARQISSPARLGPGISRMTALTRSSLVDSPNSPRNSSLNQAEDSTPLRNPREATPSSGSKPLEPKLRHLSPRDRLSNNLSVRRTSLESTTRDEVVKFINIPELEARITHVQSKYPEPHYVESMAVDDDLLGRWSLASLEGKSQQTKSALASGPTRELGSEGGLQKTSAQGSLEHGAPSLISSGHDSSPTLGRGIHPSKNETISVTGTGKVQVDKTGSTPGLLPLSRSRSSEIKSGWQSPPKSLDVRSFQPTVTPLSVSQFTDPSEVSLHEANGVRIYPHNNKSIRELDLQQQDSRPASKDGPLVGHAAGLSRLTIETEQQPFVALVDPPTPRVATNANADGYASPFTEPRQAPLPPTFVFIPPTPEPESSRSRSAGTRRSSDDAKSRPSLPQRRPSLLQRAKKYSEGLLVRSSSVRRHRQREYEPERPAHLSPMWRPEGFWDDIDSDEEYDFEPVQARLPAGGDTSNVRQDSPEARQNALPRRMSKRLPGFRGTGGFLLGNSMGIERHGTNNRRHYVSTSSRTVLPQQSGDSCRSPALRPSNSGSSLSTRSAPTVQSPLTGGKRIHWASPKRLRAHMRTTLRSRRK